MVSAAERLRAAGVADVDDSSLARALYSSDSSLYRVVPQVVVRPRGADDVLAALAVGRELDMPVTSRGAGTSIAGNAVGTGLVLDFSKHMNGVLDIDPVAQTARVEPGVVHAALQRAAMPHGLRFGPDPSTHTRCTIGGMIGNNACGNRALGYGRTADNVVSLDVAAATGEQLTIGRGAHSHPLVAGLESLARENLALIRTEFGRFGRQVSGYSLEHLLPEAGVDVARFMVGTEGTLGVVTEATVDLVTDPAARVLLLLGYPSMPDAADDVLSVLPFKPTAAEGLDSRIVDVYRTAKGSRAVPDLPAGGGWLFVEFPGDSIAQAAAVAEQARLAAGTRHARIVQDRSEQAVLWRIREEGAGLASRSFEKPAVSGWEDAAVPPENLGAYLREFDALLEDRGLHGAPFGHFGDGCVHVRIDFPLDEEGGTTVFRSFLQDAAALVAGYGGSMSGEHGDGRARSELLPVMYSKEAMALFGRVKHLWDPHNLLNPGVVVDPVPFDADLRGPASDGPTRRSGGLRLVHDGGDFNTAVHRCTGVGKCLANNTGSGGVMCPSFQATRDEKDSTRGRARVLQELIDGRLVRPDWRAPEVHEALDLCLSCKGCLSDCPTGIDMATYKSEVLYQSYKGRVRPRSHYILGRLPLWARIGAPFARLTNALMKLPGISHLARWAAGIDQRRAIPAFATRRFTPSARRHLSTADGRPPVLLWADSFTEYFSTDGGHAAVALLERAGYRVELLGRNACCGLTWITTGQLDAARKIVGDTVDVLHPYVAAGVPIVGLEPSCTAVLRSDAVELLDDPRAVEVAAGVFTLAELLDRTDDWSPPDLTGTTIVVQPHCHHSSIMGFDVDLALLARTGAAVQRLGGCCGLAGNFGVEKGHHEVSVQVAEQQLLPAVREAPHGAVVLADGFSCRTQLEGLADVQAVTLAQLLGPR